MDWTRLIRFAVFAGVPAFIIWRAAMERGTLQRLKKRAGLDEDE
jgi:hypothetical protein